MANTRSLSLRPDWPGDTDPTFVHELSRRLVDPGTEVHILAPHTAGAARRESLDGLTVHRFRYAFERFETLAYSTGILDKLRANRLNYLLVPFFLLGMTAAAYRLVRRERYTVVHAHWLIPQGAACAAALRFMAAPPPLVCCSAGAAHCQAGSSAGCSHARRRSPSSVTTCANT